MGLFKGLLAFVITFVGLWIFLLATLGLYYGG